MWRNLGGKGNSDGNRLAKSLSKRHAVFSFGEMAEWFKAAVLKTAVGVTPP
jgi:hypothetical protein